MDTEIITKIIIPVVTILISITGSIYVSNKSNTKKYTEDWLTQLREALSSFLAIGAYIPQNSSDEELWKYKKRLFDVQMLLNPENKNQGELLKRVSELQNYLMSNYSQSSKQTGDYSKMFSAIMVQYFVVVKEKQRRNG
jgi:hypothetical protein